MIFSGSRYVGMSIGGTWFKKKPKTPNCFIPDSLPASLASLHFLVSNDRTLAGQYLPIRFFWIDCLDNRLAYVNGKSYMSKQVVDYDGTILPPTDTLPTYSGAPVVCDRGRGTERIIDFYDGGIGIECPDTTQIRGDCNNNGRPWEIADAVWLTNYFSGRFNCDDCDCDPNGDGYPCHIADLIYIIRVIVGELNPDELVDTVANYTAHFVQDTVGQTISITTPDAVAALYLIMRGNVTLESLQPGVPVSYTHCGEFTKAIIYRDHLGLQITSGPLLKYTGIGVLEEVQAATMEGIMVPTVIRQASDLRVRIEMEAGQDGSGAFQGQFAEVDILLERSAYELGGFNVLIGYDATALAFYEAFEGDIFAECDWEYFTYRYGPDGNCDTNCPSGFVRVVGIAETNNGPYHPSCFLPDSLPAQLAMMKFLISNDRTLECQFVHYVLRVTFA